MIFFIVGYTHYDNPTICIEITDKSKSPISTPFHMEFLQKTKGSEILLSLGHTTTNFCIVFEDGTPLKLGDSLSSQGVETGSKLIGTQIL